MLANAVAATGFQDRPCVAEAVSAVLDQSDAALDYAGAKLAFDALIDPLSDPDATRPGRELYEGRGNPR